jgi:calcineurin-like phosphoesterase family protein
MSTVRFIGCLHLGDNWMAKHRGFTDQFEHDQYLIQKWNSVVHKRDLIYILGDITMEDPFPYHYLDQLKGRKIVVLGNHDDPKHTRELLKHVETVAGMIEYKEYCVTHCPIHPNEIGFYKGNIHAHIHHINKLSEVEVPDHYQDKDSKITKTLHKYYCVDAKLIDFEPKTLEELIK